MKFAVVLAFCLLSANAAMADEASECQAHSGTLLTGSVTSNPVFARGHQRRHVELSHTHLTLLSDQDGQSYEVAIDNVFASGYDGAGESVPTPLSGIHVGDRLDLCGKPYTDNSPGMDWVHTNCGDTPSSDKPDGWVKILRPDGTPGPNLESSQEYCSLWR